MLILIRSIRWDKARAANAVALAAGLPNAALSWDDEPGDAYRHFQRALRRGDSDGAIHIEDDVQLAPRFAERAVAAINRHGPNRVIQFFSMRKADLEVGTREEPGRTFTMTQCFYLPAGLGRPAADWIETWPGRVERPTFYDYALGAFLQARKIRYIVHVPSLVQHRSWTSSIDPRRGRTNRQSPTFTEGLANDG